MASEEEEVGWVLDGIVNLLRGPVWCVPILTFIEHKSITFEPKPQKDEEEDEEEGEENEDHRNIHQEYKILVDFLLQSFMDDLQVTPEQLEKACGMAAISTPFQRSLFEQVWAADDYPTFQTMMIQKNIELQLQALQILQYKYGIKPDSYTRGENEEDEADTREREIMDEVYRISREAHEAETEAMDIEMRDLEEAIARSTQDERDRLDKALRRPKREEEQEEEAEQEEDEDEEKKEEFSKMAVLPPISSKGRSIDPDDLKRRQEYLKGQRDKLLQMKQKEREKQLQDFEEKDCKRPQSATAARKALHGSELDAKTLAVRRALAERLKAEVIKEM